MIIWHLEQASWSKKIQQYIFFFYKIKNNTYLSSIWEKWRYFTYYRIGSETETKHSIESESVISTSKKTNIHFYFFIQHAIIALHYLAWYPYLQMSGNISVDVRTDNLYLNMVKSLSAKKNKQIKEAAFHECCALYHLSFE